MDILLHRDSFFLPGEFLARHGFWNEKSRLPQEVFLLAVIKVQSVSRRLKRHTELIRDQRIGELAVSLFESGNSAGRHKQGTRERIGLPFGIFKGSVSSPAAVKSSLLIRRHLGQPHELIGVQ